MTRPEHPPVREDADVAAEIRRALAEHGMDVAVRATSGQVALEGTVTSWELRTVAGRIAEQTTGVAQVTNHLKVPAERLRL